MSGNNQNNGNTGSWNFHGQSNTLSRNRYQGQEESITELFQRVLEGIKRLYVAARYQFHRRTLGIFRHIGHSWVKATMLIAGVYFVFFRGDSAVVNINAPLTWVSEATQGTSSVNWAAAVSMATNDDNPYAPASPSNLREQQVRNYIKRFSNVAVVEMDKFGVPASILMAQGIIESRCGESILATKVNNHFGIKCFSKKCTKGHCTNFEDDHHKDFFRQYTSAWESWRDHSKLLSSGRYKALLKEGNDYTAWAKGLKKLGYATDSSYDTKLISIIRKYQLEQLDDL